MAEFHLITETDYIIAYTGRNDERLSSGMKLGEAMHKACHWWATKGRLMMEDMKRHQIRTTGGAFASADPDNPNFVNSGILNAKPWSALNGREKVEVMVQWHNSHVKIPDTTDLKNPTYEMGKGYVEYDQND